MGVDMEAVSASTEPARPSERVKVATLITLTGIGGYVDAVSYLGLGRVFTAAMTGNTVLLALAVAERDWGAVLRSATALIGFVGGVALGQIVVGRFEARTRWPRAVGSGLAVELALLVVLAVAWYLTPPRPVTATLHLPIAMSALAMGVQSATARRLGVAAVSTTYVTGTLTSLTSGTVEWLRSGERRRSARAEHLVAQPNAAVVHGPGLPSIAWGAYAAGALAGGLVVMLAPTVALMPALLAVLAVAVLDVRAG
jgi:uncharacterized membrane protein YoaK (UPF0700 family)